MKYNLNLFRTTSKKKPDCSPNIYLLVNKNIASGSMLSSYHLQKNEAFVIGSAPDGLFNTFGKTNGYKLPHSKIVYSLASASIFLSKETPKRMENMLIPNCVPSESLNINQIIQHINSRQ